MVQCRCRAAETDCQHEHERERFGGALPPQEGRAVDGPTDKGIGMTGWFLLYDLYRNKYRLHLNKPLWELLDKELNCNKWFISLNFYFNSRCKNNSVLSLENWPHQMLVSIYFHSSPIPILAQRERFLYDSGDFIIETWKSNWKGNYAKSSLDLSIFSRLHHVQQST